MENINDKEDENNEITKKLETLINENKKLNENSFILKNKIDGLNKKYAEKEEKWKNEEMNFEEKIRLMKETFVKEKFAIELKLKKIKEEEEVFLIFNYLL